MELQIDFSRETEKRKLYKLLKSLKPVPYVLKIKKWQKKRSISQNKYYWGVVIEILSSETGFFPEEMHDVLKKKFNPKVKVLKQTGEELLIGGTTTEMETLEFENYLESVRTWALTELDIYIPLPNES